MQQPRKKQSWQMVISEAESSSALESTERVSSSTMEPLREWLRSQSQQVSARLIWLLKKMSSAPSSPFHIFWVSTCSDPHPADLYLNSAQAAYPAFRLFMSKQQIKIIQTTIHSTINYILPPPLPVSLFIFSLLFFQHFWNSRGHYLPYKARFISQSVMAQLKQKKELRAISNLEKFLNTYANIPNEYSVSTIDVDVVLKDVSANILQPNTDDQEINRLYERGINLNRDIANEILPKLQSLKEDHYERILYFIEHFNLRLNRQYEEQVKRGIEYGIYDKNDRQNQK